jgi:predicted RNase H-like nuclease (RuvC/YqgF family)
MTINYEQLPEQIQEVAMEIQLKEQKVTYLEREQHENMDVIKSQPFVDHAARTEQYKTNNQSIDKLQTELQLLKWKQRILEDAAKAGRELQDLESRVKVTPVFTVSVTNPNGTLEVFESKVRIEFLKHELQELETELTDQQRHESEVIK